MKKLCLLVCMSLGLSATAVAEGDAEAGKAKSAVCAACHGPDGNSMIEMNPKIADQHPDYLVKQLQEFKLAAETGGEEGRNNAVMNGMAAPLSLQDMQDLAAYFASQEMTPGETPEEFVEPGRALYQGGDEERGITACIACHGPQGNGMGLAGFPDISGQHAAYTEAQLKAFRSGTRHNDMNGMMRDIASKLTDEDIEILSNYVAGLH
ncbi:cytochrome c4 [Alteromonas sp. ASW11-19]|uniref:Cytochrome c4 n=1 Tax=Alteromonas salexigens TaxID=2982530 RepID=A0ABT2VK32_9ALTE|nr:cytochrome c4 [Alteromonas salexigens]MCU7553630.1 cytochrome c4 [Alteromonas salexigens]